MTATAVGLTGEVVRPGDAGYDEARLGWNKFYSHYPGAIVYCHDAQDVLNAVKWARREGVALRARSGGHCIEGWSAIDGGLVIDVSRMKNIEFEEAAGTVRVGTGVIQREAVAALGERGYVMSTGAEGTVGLGGVILGGGFGLLTRQFGMACDALLAAEIVVADDLESAKIIEVEQNTNADLLWACRGGGGGNFGITTAYTLKLNELRDVQFVIARWDGHGDLGDVLRVWQRDAPVADERLSSAVESDGTHFELTAVMHGASRDEAEAGLASVLAIGDPEVTFLEGSWPDLYASADRGPDLPYWKFHSQFITEPFPDTAIDTVLHYLANCPTPESNFFCSSFGGAVRNAPPGGSAFPHRDALFYCEPGAAWDDLALSSKTLAWASDFWRALRPYGTAGYVNVPNAPAADWEREYYGANVDRLRQVKAKYDPHNVFNFEQSVPPVNS